jgi:hypothetical protein
MRKNDPELFAAALRGYELRREEVTTAIADIQRRLGKRAAINCFTTREEAPSHQSRRPGEDRGGAAEALG